MPGHAESSQGRAGPRARVSPSVPTRGVAALVALVLAALLASSLLVPAGAGATAGSRFALTALEQSTVESINALRVAHGLSPLLVSSELFRSASSQCLQMVEGGYFGHDAPGGEGFAARLERFYPPTGTSYYAVGENLYWTVATASSSAIVARWMESADHRSNLLDPGWREM